MTVSKGTGLPAFTPQRQVCRSDRPKTRPASSTLALWPVPRGSYRTAALGDSPGFCARHAPPHVATHPLQQPQRLRANGRPHRGCLCLECVTVGEVTPGALYGGPEGTLAPGYPYASTIVRYQRSVDVLTRKPNGVARRHEPDPNRAERLSCIAPPTRWRRYGVTPGAGRPGSGPGYRTVWPATWSDSCKPVACRFGTTPRCDLVERGGGDARPSCGTSLNQPEMRRRRLAPGLRARPMGRRTRPGTHMAEFSRTPCPPAGWGSSPRAGAGTGTGTSGNGSHPGPLPSTSAGGGSGSHPGSSCWTGGTHAEGLGCRGNRHRAKPDRL